MGINPGWRRDRTEFIVGFRTLVQLVCRPLHSPVDIRRADAEHQFSGEVALFVLQIEQWLLFNHAVCPYLYTSSRNMQFLFSLFLVECIWPRSWRKLETLISIRYDNRLLPRCILTCEYYSNCVMHPGATCYLGHMLLLRLLSVDDASHTSPVLLLVVLSAGDSYFTSLVFLISLTPGCLVTCWLVLSFHFVKFMHFGYLPTKYNYTSSFLIYLPSFK